MKPLHGINQLLKLALKNQRKNLTDFYVTPLQVSQS